MSRKDTLIRAVKRGGKLYREMPDGSEVEMPVPPGRRMTQEEIHAAALRDPDNPPRSAEQFQVPLGTLRDWEQGRVEPDQAAKAYLKVIAHNPALVLAALQAGPGHARDHSPSDGKTVDEAAE